MILTDRELLVEINDGNIRFEPDIDRARQIQDASVDVRLGRTLRIPQELPNVVIQPTDRITPNLYGEEEAMADDGFILRPNRLVLGATYEKIMLPLYLAGRLEGRSSLARLGISVHLTSGHIAPGFSRPVVLEIVNFGVNPVMLKPLMYIAQVVFEKVSMLPSKAYSGQFKEQEGP
jgi:dCTP deaminase